MMKNSETLPSAVYCLEPMMYLPITKARMVAINRILRYSGRITDILEILLSIEDKI